LESRKSSLKPSSRRSSPSKSAKAWCPLSLYFLYDFFFFIVPNYITYTTVTYQSFVARTEAQLVGAEGLRIRGVVNEAYTAMVKTMFECLQQMAKMDGDGAGVAAEDKDQLNYHVVLIGRCLVICSRIFSEGPFSRKYAPLPHDASEPKGTSSSTFRYASKRNL
jgi:hypothetical protein